MHNSEHFVNNAPEFNLGDYSMKNNPLLKIAITAIGGLFCAAAMTFSPDNESHEPQDVRETRIRDMRIENDPNCQPERYTENGIRDCSPVQK